MAVYEIEGPFGSLVMTHRGDRSFDGHRLYKDFVIVLSTSERELPENERNELIQLKWLEVMLA